MPTRARQIDVVGGARRDGLRAGGEEEAGLRGRGVGGDEVEVSLPLAGDEARGLRLAVAVGALVGGGEAVEPGEQRERQAVVVAVALDGLAVGAGVGVGLAVKGAAGERVGELLALEQQRGVPAEREGGATGALAEGVGGLRRQPDLRGGGLDGGGLGEGDEEEALAVGRPTVGAARRLEVRALQRAGEGEAVGQVERVRWTAGGCGHRGAS